jgi:hypothetical protein
MIPVLNRFLPARFDEFVSHLTLGIEPLDAFRRSRVTNAMDVAFDPPAGTRLAMSPHRRQGLREGADTLIRLDRHPSLVYVLLYDKRLKGPFQLRFHDPARRFVPRRIKYLVPADLVEVVRIGRPSFFPGAAYPVAGNATGIRGRAVWETPTDGAEIPIPWVRAVATVDKRIVGRASGDDRGEFLLLLQSDATRDVPELVESLKVTVQVTVFVPSSPPLPSFGDDRGVDPLQGLPVETVQLADEDVPMDDEFVPGAGAPLGNQPWSSGKQISRDVSFTLGRLLSPDAPFVFKP